MVPAWLSCDESCFPCLKTFSCVFTWEKEREREGERERERERERFIFLLREHWFYWSWALHVRPHLTLITSVIALYKLHDGLGFCVCILGEDNSVHIKHKISKLHILMLGFGKLTN
jgi:hypothetical protein